MEQMFFLLKVCDRDMSTSSLQPCFKPELKPR